MVHRNRRLHVVPVRAALLGASLAPLACSPAPPAAAPQPPAPEVVPALPPAAADIPFQIQLERVATGALPGLQSMIAVPFEDKLLLMAGRTNGLHGFPGQSRAAANPSFPRQHANGHAYLVQQDTGEVLASASVLGLPQNVVQQLTASNTQYAVSGDGVLYVAGGYGYAPGGQGMLTLQQVMAVSLAELAAAIQKNALDAAFAASSVYVGSHPALAITGGSMQPADALNQQGFLLIFGQQFDGVYSTGGGVAVQTYSESVRQFTFTPGASGATSGKATGALQVNLVAVEPPISRDRPPEATRQYHRRDLTVLPLLSPDGDERIAALGGVFVPGQMAGFLNPVLIEPSASAPGFSLKVDEAASQWLSQYEAAALPIHSQHERATYVTLFGGISQYYWKDGKLARDTPDFNVDPPVDGLPFINSISTLKMLPAGTAQFIHEGQAFPPPGQEPVCGTASSPAPYLGAETVFVPSPNALDENGYIQLDALQQPTVVGHLVGGIAALAPYPGDQTCASASYYEVTLVPNRPTRSVRLRAGTGG
jgi:hypothetical protein